MGVAILSLAVFAASAALADENSSSDLNLQDRVERYSFQPLEIHREQQERAEPSAQKKKKPAAAHREHHKKKSNEPNQ